MNESRERYQRTIDEWARHAILEMLRSSDPIAVYREQDMIIRLRIKAQLSSARRTSESLGAIAFVVLFAATTTIYAVAVAWPFIVLPTSILTILVISTWRSDRRARLREAILRFDP